MKNKFNSDSLLQGKNHCVAARQNTSQINPNFGFQNQANRQGSICMGAFYHKSIEKSMNLILSASK